MLAFLVFIWYELKASEARQEKLSEELRADMKELRAEVKASEARQREDMAQLKADDRALAATYSAKRGSGPDGMPATPAPPPVTVNVSINGPGPFIEETRAVPEAASPVCSSEATAHPSPTPTDNRAVRDEIPPLGGSWDRVPSQTIALHGGWSWQRGAPGATQVDLYSYIQRVKAARDNARQEDVGPCHITINLGQSAPAIAGATGQPLDVVEAELKAAGLPTEDTLQIGPPSDGMMQTLPPLVPSWLPQLSAHKVCCGPTCPRDPCTSCNRQCSRPGGSPRRHVAGSGPCAGDGYASTGRRT